MRNKLLWCNFQDTLAYQQIHRKMKYCILENQCGIPCWTFGGILSSRMKTSPCFVSEGDVLQDLLFPLAIQNTTFNLPVKSCCSLRFHLCPQAQLRHSLCTCIDLFLMSRKESTRRKAFLWRRRVKFPSYLDWTQPETVNLQGKLTCMCFLLWNSGEVQRPKEWKRTISQPSSGVCSAWNSQY